MILLIDNYDSFVYNLYQLVGSMRPDVTVMRNDALTCDDIEALAPDAIILSPGPGRPADAGVCIPAIKRFAGRIPILGVCLGHQAICEAFGGTVGYARELMHGKAPCSAACPMHFPLPATTRLQRMSAPRRKTCASPPGQPMARSWRSRMPHGASSACNSTRKAS